MSNQKKRIERGSLVKRGNTYSVKFTLNGKQILKVLKDSSGRSITTKSDAEKAKNILLAQYGIRDQKELTQKMLDSLKSYDAKLIDAAKKADDILNPALTFSNAWNAYLKNQERPQPGERTLKDYSGYFNKFYSWKKKAYPEIIHLKEISKSVAGDYALFLKQSKFSPGTFNKHRDFLKIFFHYLKDIAKIEINPFESVKRLKNNPNSRRELTELELKTILEKAEGKLQLLLGIGTFTGLRLGDCCTLLWKEINLDTKIIKRVTNKTGGKPLTIGIPNVLYSKLIETPHKQRKSYLFPALAERYNDVNKRPMITNTIQNHLKKCGINLYKEGTGEGTQKRAVLEVGFHSLRHSYISISAKRGISQNILTKLAGHSSKMSEHYTHLQDGEAVEIAQNTFNSFLEPANEIITINPLEPTEEQSRINLALDYLQIAAIPKEEKENLIKILEGME